VNPFHQEMTGDQNTVSHEPVEFIAMRTKDHGVHVEITKGLETIFGTVASYFLKAEDMTTCHDLF